MLFYVGRKPVLNYLSERRQRIQDNLANSEKLLTEAEGRLAEWTERAERLDDEIAEVHRLARERAEQERAQILEDARATAERIKRDAASGVEREVERAKQALRDEAADLAVELAGKMLEEHVNEPHNSKIISKYGSFAKDHHAVAFLCDSLKLFVAGVLDAHNMDELMERDLEVRHHEELEPAGAMTGAGGADREREADLVGAAIVGGAIPVSAAASATASSSAAFSLAISPNRLVDAANSAPKSTRTGRSAWTTSSSNVASVTFGKLLILSSVSGRGPRESGHESED